MNNISKKPLSNLGYNFVDQKYLPEGKNEYYLRDEQHNIRFDYRKLTAHEIEVLVKNENTADDWTSIYVTNHFNPNLVKGCKFYGMVRIGALGNFFLEFHSLQLPVGLYNSTIVSCDIGNNVVINNVKFLSHYQIGDEVILVNIDEMMTSSTAKFGNGILKYGEEESKRIWLEICNENGGRKVMPFNGMLAGDAYMWSKYRGNKALMQRFAEMTNNQYSQQHGFYGTIGDRTIIKNCSIIKDVKVGSDAYIKGGNKLKNLTINSNARAKSQIGEGVELVNGIVGYGSRIFYGVKAVRFITGTNTQLKYGARLINSYLGDNATVSCCEVLNSLIFPGHEQHHNNSFLCASVLKGQTNIAAGATLGSNHNSRGNDGEMVAGRGFWPGLCVSLKHNSIFASYVLMSKGSYQYELNITLPFTLVINNETDGTLDLMPGYWMLYNMYALARNSWKYGDRDKRIVKTQLLEFDFLAPDTITEIIEAKGLLELWTGQAFYEEKAEGMCKDALRNKGKDLLINAPDTVNKLTIHGEGQEASKRPVRVLKCAKAYEIYNDMIHFFAVKTIMNWMDKQHLQSISGLQKSLELPENIEWINLGGQLVTKESLEQLKSDIISEKISTWDEVHHRYKLMGSRYNEKVVTYALKVLLQQYEVKAGDGINPENWTQYLLKAESIMQMMLKGTIVSREKDYKNPFRNSVYDSEEEMEAVVGNFGDNAFIKKSQKDMAEFSSKIQRFVEMEQEVNVYKSANL